MNYEMVERNYNRGLWALSMVKLAVRKGVITREEFETITGVKYQPDNRRG